MQGLFVHPDVDTQPVRLGVVRHEVLGGGGDAAGLDALDESGAGPAGEERILGEALEVPATQRGPLQIQRGGEEHIHSFAPSLRGEQHTEIREQALVPGGGQCRGGGQDERGLALVPGLAAHSGGPVGEGEGAQSDSRFGVRAPGARTGQQAHLLCRVELLQQRIDLFVRHDGPAPSTPAPTRSESALPVCRAQRRWPTPTMSMGNGSGRAAGEGPDEARRRVWPELAVLLSSPAVCT